MVAISSALGQITHAHTVIGKAAVVERHCDPKEMQALQATLDPGTWWRGRAQSAVFGRFGGIRTLGLNGRPYISQIAVIGQ
jgi:hypothetical protein